MYRGNLPRNFHGISPRNFRGNTVSAALSLPETTGSRFCALLRERYGRLKHATKILARDACVTPRTAENWLERECAPRFEQAIELMAADPAIEAAVLEMVRGRRAEREQP